MKPIRWSRAALRDYRDAIEWLDERNPAAAKRIADAINRRLSTLPGMPRLGRPGRVSGTRELVIPRTPYLIIYKLEDDTDAVFIVRLMHSARLWPPHGL